MLHVTAKSFGPRPVDGVACVHGRQAAHQHGHFRLFDLGSTNGTRVNSRLVRQPMLLEKDDVVQLGDNTRLRFVK
jgi:pSer/pThr/pTyr-binding forkhead associated (FHA) protein